MTPVQIALELGKTGVCVCPDFLNVARIDGLRDDLNLQMADGNFKRAGIGQGSKKNVEDRVRRDQIHWWERENSNVVQTKLWTELDSLKKAFNRNLFLGLQDFTGHYAHYAKDGYYKRHRDSLPVKNDRVVSIVLYLNENWQLGDGGQLRIYEQDKSHQDVKPIGGTLVCFMSQDSEHEVLQSHSSRFSFTGWFTTPPLAV